MQYILSAREFNELQNQLSNLKTLLESAQHTNADLARKLLSMQQDCLGTAQALDEERASNAFYRQKCERLQQEVNTKEYELHKANKALVKVRTLAGNCTVGEVVEALRRPTINEYGEIER